MSLYVLHKSLLNMYSTKVYKSMKMKPIIPSEKKMASLYWKSKATNMMNYIGVFYWTQEVGDTWTSGKSCTLGPERQNNSVSPLRSSPCISFTLPLQITFLSSSRPMVKYDHPEFSSYSSKWTDWPGPLGSNFKFLGKKILLAQLCSWSNSGPMSCDQGICSCSRNVGRKAPLP